MMGVKRKHPASDAPSDSPKEKRNSAGRGRGAEFDGAVDRIMGMFG